MSLARSSFYIGLYACFVSMVLASPAQETFGPATAPSRYFDVQAHRGGRGNTVENTLPAFAWSLIDGSTTLEMDNGITSDGVVVVWHDENIVAEKCLDTQPAFPNDPMYPYVGKYVANLTLAQLRTLDCGSLRQSNFPLQMTYPGTRISTMTEVFDFVKCADPRRNIRWNIEAKINATYSESTVGVDEFVERQFEEFSNSGYLDSITYQSFDWRTLVGMKKRYPSMTTSALIDDDTAAPVAGSYPWLAGLDLDSFPGPTRGARVAQAAHAAGANILSPYAKFLTRDGAGASFTTKEMVDEAHRLGLGVLPWTVNTLEVVEGVMALGVDGIISDYPNVVRRWIKEHGYPVAPKYPKKRVLACLNEHLGYQHRFEQAVQDN